MIQPPPTGPGQGQGQPPVMTAPRPGMLPPQPGGAAEPVRHDAAAARRPAAGRTKRPKAFASGPARAGCRRSRGGRLKPRRRLETAGGRLQAPRLISGHHGNAIQSARPCPPARRWCAAASTRRAGTTTGRPIPTGTTTRPTSRSSTRSAAGSNALPAGTRVLDAGCGEGVLVDEYGGRLDIDGRRRELLLGARAHGSLTALPFPERVVRSRAVPRRARAPGVRGAAARARGALSRPPARRRAARLGAEPGAPAVARPLPAAGTADPHRVRAQAPGRSSGRASTSSSGAAPGSRSSPATASSRPCRSSRTSIRRHPRALAPLHRAADAAAAGPGLVLPEPAHVPQAVSACFLTGDQEIRRK